MILPYVGLLAALLVIWAASFWVSGYELFSPASLVALGMCVSVLLAIIGTGTWNTTELGGTTIAIVVVGSVAFLAGCALVEWLLHRRGRRQLEGASSSADATSTDAPKENVLVRILSHEPDEVALWKHVVMSVLVLVAIYLRVTETYEIGEQIGADTTSWSNLVSAVRNATAAFKTTEYMTFDVGFSFIERQMEKVASCVGYVSVYFAVSSFVKKKKLLQRMAPIAVVCVCVAYVLSTGGRATILFYVIAACVDWYLLSLVRGAKVLRLSVIATVAAAVVLVIGSVGFYFSSFLIGRGTGSGIVEYISFYFGGSVPSLQVIVESGISEYEITGSMSFYGFFSALYKLGFIEDLQTYSLAWVDMGGHSSNIFTYLARYYFDFGFAGVVVLPLVSGAFLTFVYRFVRSRNWPFLLGAYSYWAVCMFDMAREEYVFRSFFALSMIAMLIIMLCLTLFVTVDFGKLLKQLKARLTPSKSAVS